jgi:hypothetical protein
MRCCTPETIVVTCSGFSGTLLPHWVNIVDPQIHPFTEPLLDLDLGLHGCAYQLGSEPGCVPFTTTEWNPDEERVQFTADAIWPPCMMAQILWPNVAFPQNNVVITTPGPFAGKCLDGQGVYFDGFEADGDCAAKCAVPGAGRLCANPGDTSVIYGPAGHARVYQADFNDSYVCHRYDVYLRPEFDAVVNRTQEVPDTAIDARLAFDVYCRRNWQFSAPCNGDIILNLSCAVSDSPPESPPEGSYYCIDYRCGPRMPDTSVGGSLCDQHRCTAHEGTVWPHLFPYPQDGNYSASIRLTLTPDSYYTWFGGYAYQASKPAKPMTWRVLEASVTEAGEGYEVGQFFVIDFDQSLLGTTGGGEVNVAFPATEPECGFPVNWADDYGYEALEDGDARFYYQRLRVEQVDENGGIVSLSVVPWYMTPEFRPGACGVEITNKARKTKHYPAYTRIICHPNSVDIGGTGYRINDTITFRTASPGVETYAAAIAKVTDVDDDGAVLDWEIKGSDIWRYGFGNGNPTCDIYGQPDERGAYKWVGKYLCELRWHGVGVPARAVDGYGDGFSGIQTWINSGRLTEIDVQVQRVPCRTTISVVVDTYLYDSLSFLLAADDEDASLVSRLLKLCPPYPKCVGGGAQITPIIGTTGANESGIGGPLAGGEVQSGGGYYAFVDKTHGPPILPKAVPDIDGGSGAVIDDFTFDSVLDFPSPGYAAGQLHEPSATRFAYYPVASASIASGGSGYEVGQEFDVQPSGGAAYDKAWKRGGGDDPDARPNGGWYSGTLAYTNESGYVVLSEGEARASVCRLRVASVGPDGEITSLEVVDGGMMFRATWAAGVRHPDVRAYVGSDTGHGAAATITVDADKTSDTFGEVTDCQIVAIPVEQMVDPVHSTVESPVPYPLGGRDYANPPSGEMWEIANFALDSIIGAPSQMCKIDYHNFPYNALHPSDSQYELIEGSYPPFHSRAEGCTLDPCYHSLLNRGYALFRAWGNSGGFNGPAFGLDTQNRIDQWWEGCATDAPNSYSPLPTSRAAAGRPSNPYGVFRRKGKITAVYLENPVIDPLDPDIPDCGLKIADQPGYDGLPSAQPGDYIVIEWGFSAGVSSTTPTYPNCPDHNNGRTAE